MHDVKELSRRTAPATRCQPLALLGNSLWVGSWDTHHVYAIDPKTWTVTEDVAAPGQPYGLATVGDELRVVVSLGEDDDRYLYTFVPGKGFDEASKAPCPEFNGSHLAADGTTLYLCQATNGRIVELDASAKIVREIALPSRCAGMGFGPGGFHIIAADEEFENLQFATLDLSQSKPDIAPIAGIPFDARALVFDGSAWWTCEREASEIVSFSIS